MYGGARSPYATLPTSCTKYIRTNHGGTFRKIESRRHNSIYRFDCRLLILQDLIVVVYGLSLVHMRAEMQRDGTKKKQEERGKEVGSLSHILPKCVGAAICWYVAHGAVCFSGVTRSWSAWEQGAWWPLPAANYSSIPRAGLHSEPVRRAQFWVDQVGV